MPAAEAQTPRAVSVSTAGTRLEKAASESYSHLKWRPSTKIHVAEKPVEPVKNEPTLARPVGIEPAGAVQQVSHVQLTSADGQQLAQGGSKIPPSDPFNDPFNDQLQKFTAQPSAPPSRFSQPPVEPPSGEQPMAQPMEEDPSVPTPPATRQPMLGAPQPMTPSQPQSPSQLPMPGYGESNSPMGSSKPDCDTVYRQRNCCEESESCTAIRAELDKISIRNISVDISAPFAPDADDAATAGSLQAQAMQASPVREWRNAEGELIGEGRLLDLRSRRISIDTGSEIKRIPLKSLGSDERCFVAAYWNTPYECGWNDEEFLGRHWAPLEVNWTASALCHKPLYFEERALERYGHTTGPVSQVVLSGAHFFASAALLPYQMGIHPPNECMYALGYYRPGNCAPYLVPPVPLSARGAAAQGAAVLGAVYWIP
ncbi:hypothetical protein [Blastopirellula marina]|uniref:hypothetical protein n=1 Tax=Blastopirellula marina TaxID=124 RepID=UPI0011B08FD9|nr:hypothetical protein [Blastopirellula marina]